MVPQPNNQILSTEEIPFADMRQAFARAAGAGLRRRQYLVAGYVVELRIVGEVLADDVTRAFAHLDTLEARHPALTIELWEEEAPESFAQPTWEPLPDEMLIMMRASDDGRFVCEQRPHGIAILDRSAHRIVACTRGSGQRHLDERARPFHRLLSTWLNDRGVQFVHAGLVSARGQGILFGGRGGAGKSTTSVACLRAGLTYLGDDFIGLEHLDDGSYRGYGLFATCLLELEHVNRFEDLKPNALAPNYPNEDKALFYLEEMFPGTVSPSTRIDGIALPRITDEDRSFHERAAKAETMLALSPTSIMLLPVPTAKAFHALAQLVERVPCYRLYIGRDIDRIPEAVLRLAGELDAGPKPWLADGSPQTPPEN